MTDRDAAPPRLPRPAVHPETLLALGAFYLLAAGNGPFWRAALAGRAWSDAGTWAFAGAVFLMLAAFYFAVMGVVAHRAVLRPMLAVLLVVTASASYFMDRYAVYLDRAMLRNVLATNAKEAGELLGWPLVAHVVVFGVLPAALLWWPALRERPWKRALAVRAAWVIGALVVAGACLMSVFADLASLMRNHREMRHLITPGNVVAALAGNAFGRVAHAGPRKVVGGDAKPGMAAGRRPVLFVLVVGETARAQNFSLNGYARATNPELARRDVINFAQATACGTSTEVSLPCMFSPFGRSNYDEGKILSHESVLHVLARAGVQVLWRDNQSGCKGVCEGLPQQQLDRANVPGLCESGQCFDEILLHGLDSVVRDAHGNLLVVMHQLGSHGPAYYKRYPARFKRFTPACETDELRQCGTEQVVNAYDNTILYTDAVLGQAIDFLQQAQKTHDTALLYVSDHGESLGEAGLFLHGVPWAIAPAVQTHVPFVLWVSPALRAAAAIDDACLRRRGASQPVSHDWLFHSLLGVFEVRTQAYDAKLDVFSGCGAAVKPAGTRP